MDNQLFDCKNAIIPGRQSQAMDNAESIWKIWPIVRHNHQMIAFNAYKSNDMEKAILYDCMALSCGFIGSILGIDRLGQRVNYKTIYKTIQWQQNTGNKLFDYLAAVVNDVSLNETISKTINADDHSRFNELCTKCIQLPNEWNVIQLSQMYAGYNSYATKKDMYTVDAPIKITLFRHSLPETQKKRPISIVLDLFEFGEKSIFSTAYEIHQRYSEYSANMDPLNYPTFLKALSQIQTKLVDDMSNWLGAWITLFCGKIKGAAGRKFEQEIFQQVDNFCNSISDITEDQRCMLSLIARRIDLIANDKIEQAAREITTTTEQYECITLFLTELKKNTIFKGFEYYPCILIVDEILDGLPWEMVLTTQQFTRVHSIYLLFDLYDRYKDQIVDGYLKVHVKNGFVLINPDNDKKLEQMNARLQHFYGTCFPDWRQIVGSVPTLDQITQGLANSNLFVYSGHGSSLQFFSSMQFEQMKNNTIMMLFGCESIAMKVSGTICESACSAYTYFQSGCPGILGATTIVTDIWIDVITIALLTQWTASKDIVHPNIQICKDDVTKERVNRILNKLDGKRNPNLLQLLCHIRSEKDINIRMRSAIVYRGLPPYNTAC